MISNRISVGELLAFTILLSRVNRPLGNVMFCMNDIRASKVAMDRLETLYQAKKRKKLSKENAPGMKWSCRMQSVRVQSYGKTYIFLIPLTEKY